MSELGPGRVETFLHGGARTEDEPTDEIDGEKLIQDEEDQAAEAAGAIAASISDLALVDEMLEIARKHGHRPDCSYWSLGRDPDECGQERSAGNKKRFY